jgi:hypothetical protein
MTDRFIPKNASMGNYRDIETNFVERTLALLEQYEVAWKKYKFEEQYNYTLLINCMLGLIVLPKEKSVAYLPNDSLLDQKSRNAMGIYYSWFHEDIKELKTLIVALRHCIAHFHIRVESVDDQFHIDHIIFEDPKKGEGHIVAEFQANELLPFLRFYTSWLLDNLRKYKKSKKEDTE